MHKLPIISHKAQWNAHIETIGAGGVVVSNSAQYASVLTEWVLDISRAKKIGVLGYDLAAKKYSFPAIVSRFEKVLIEVTQNVDFTSYKVIKNYSKGAVSINYVYLVRYLFIKIINRASTIALGKAGPGAVLRLQQFYNRLRYK